MGFRVALFGFCLVSNITFEGPNLIQNSLAQNVWSQVTTPSQGPAESIGFYSNGCLAGARALPFNGPGYQVMRLSRHRYFGHPELVQWVQDLGTTMDALGFSLLVSDIGQPRGGPLSYGHASHQIGLDIDIWFWSHPEQRTRPLTWSERDQLPMISVLNASGTVDPRNFGYEQILKLRMAAESRQVQRIFVNPAIKAYLCLTLDPQERGWLHRLRPWPGHDSHFHVRMYCPASSKNCVAQDEQPAGDGCAEVFAKDDWILEESHLKEIMPAACAKVLKERGTKIEPTTQYKQK